MNTMLHIQGTEQDFEDWPKTSKSWNWKDVLPYYIKSQSSPMQVKKFSNPKQNFVDILLEAGVEKGHTKAVESNELGYSLADGTLYEGSRFSAAKAHLRPAKTNLHIIKKAFVTKITLDNRGRPNGVEFLYNNTSPMTVASKKEIIITAGPIASPQLLMLSGIGPKNTLNKLQIPIVKNLPVGKNLQDIVYVPLYFQFHASTAAPLTKSDLLDNVYLYAVNGTGNLAGLGISNIIAHWNMKDNTRRPNIQITHKYFPTNAFDLQFYLTVSGYAEMVGRQILDNNQRAEIVVMNVGLMRPKSTGTVTLTSGDSQTKIKLRTKYFTHSDDVATMLKALKHAASFVDTKEFIKHEAKLVRLPLADCKGMEYQSDEYWRCYMASMSRSAGRQFGSTRMGDNELDSVVDGRLKVHGVDGLRIVGSSVLPTSAGGQSNAATLMVAERSSDFVKSDWLGKEQRVEL